MNVCSYSFFRNAHSNYESDNCGVAKGKFFINYFPSLLRFHAHVWKGWELWIYHDNRVTEYAYWRVIEVLATLGFLKLIPFGQSDTLTGKGGMLERFNPAFDWDVEYLVMRDIDGLPMPRDRKMVEQGLFDYGALAHTVQDSVSHSGCLGGTLSVNCKKFRDRFQVKSLQEFMDRASGMHINWDKLGGDQLFLNSYFVPNLAADWVIHTMKPVGGEFCKARLQVLPRETEEDKLFNHVGGCGDAERAVKWFDEQYPNNLVLQAEREI